MNGIDRDTDCNDSFSALSAAIYGIEKKRVFPQVSFEFPKRGKLISHLDFSGFHDIFRSYAGAPTLTGPVSRSSRISLINKHKLLNIKSL